MINKASLQSIAAALLLLAAGAAQAADPAMTGQTSKGDALVDAKGMTLYVFDKDTDGASACYDKCAVNWPPLMAMDGAAAGAHYSIVSRKDGGKQWAYKGKPLYLWIKDTKPGDVTGDGVQGVWHLAKP